jgi:hypothetical protein
MCSYLGTRQALICALKYLQRETTLGIMADQVERWPFGFVTLSTSNRKVGPEAASGDQNTYVFLVRNTYSWVLRTWQAQHGEELTDCLTSNYPLLNESCVKL